MLRWLERTDLRFVKSIPRSKPFRPIATEERLFQPEEPCHALERLAVELAMIPTGRREGGFFTVIARKPRTRSDAGDRPEGTP